MRVVIKVEPGVEEPELERVLRPVIEVLVEGGIAIYPTDTVYGVGGRIDLEEALEKVSWAKMRGTAPFPLLVSDIDRARNLAVFNSRALRLAERFWPGPLTLKLRPRFEAHPLLVDDRGLIAVRLPDNPVPRVLARGIGGAIVGTSANRSGAPSPTSFEGAVKQIGERVDAGVDGGPTRYRVASTIVDVSSQPVRIVRVGAVSPEEVEEALGEEVAVG